VVLMAQTVNVIGAIKTTRTDAWLETTGQALKLYRQHFGAIPVAVKESMKDVDVAAAWTEDRSALIVAAVNTKDKPVIVTLELQGITLPESVSGWTIQNNNAEAYNDENNNNNVAIQEIEIAVKDGKIELAPYSVTMIKIPSGN